MCAMVFNQDKFKNYVPCYFFVHGIVAFLHPGLYTHDDVFPSLFFFAHVAFDFAMHWQKINK